MTTLKPNKSFYPDPDLHMALIESYGDYGTREINDLVRKGLDIVHKKSVGELKQEEEAQWNLFIKAHNKRFNLEQELELERKVEELNKTNSESKKYFEKITSKLSPIDLDKNIKLLDMAIQNCPFPELVKYFKQLKSTIGAKNGTD